MDFEISKKEEIILRCNSSENKMELVCIVPAPTSDLYVMWNHSYMTKYFAEIMGEPWISFSIEKGDSFLPGHLFNLLRVGTKGNFFSVLL